MTGAPGPFGYGPGPARDPTPRRVGPPFGENDDPRYPSPRQLRRSAGVVVDLVLTAGVFVVVLQAARALPGFFGQYVTVTALIGALAFSALHRIVFQRLTQATTGKLLFGLVSISRATGTAPTIGALTKSWLFLLLYLVWGVLDVPTSREPRWEVFPAVVRRRDLTGPPRWS